MVFVQSLVVFGKITNWCESIQVFLRLIYFCLCALLFCVLELCYLKIVAMEQSAVPTSLLSLDNGHISISEQCA